MDRTSTGKSIPLVHWTVRSDGRGGWEGEIQVLIGEQHAIVRGVGASEPTAMERAANLASRLVNDKYLSMVLPPQAKMAVQTVRLMSRFLRRGKRRRAQKLVRGPETRQLATALGLYKTAARNGNGAAARNGNGNGNGVAAAVLYD